jgi:hypothetical protein
MDRSGRQWCGSATIEALSMNETRPYHPKKEHA